MQYLRSRLEGLLPADTDEMKASRAVQAAFQDVRKFPIHTIGDIGLFLQEIHKAQQKLKQEVPSEQQDSAGFFFLEELINNIKFLGILQKIDGQQTRVPKYQKTSTLDNLDIMVNEIEKRYQEYLHSHRASAPNGRIEAVPWEPMSIKEAFMIIAQSYFGELLTRRRR